MRTLKSSLSTQYNLENSGSTSNCRNLLVSVCSQLGIDGRRSVESTSVQIFATWGVLPQVRCSVVGSNFRNHEHVQGRLGDRLHRHVDVPAHEVSAVRHRVSAHVTVHLCGHGLGLREEQTQVQILDVTRAKRIPEIALRITHFEHQGESSDVVLAALSASVDIIGRDLHFEGVLGAIDSVLGRVVEADTVGLPVDLSSGGIGFHGVPSAQVALTCLNLVDVIRDSMLGRSEACGLPDW